MCPENMNPIKVVSLHWGFIPGGVAAYARYIEGVALYAPITVKSLCINSSKWPFDEANARHIDMDLIEIKGRLDPSWIWKTRKWMKKHERPDLILTYGFNGCFAAKLSTLGLNIPIVSAWHGDYIPTTVIQKLRKPVFEVIEKVLFRYVVKEIVTVSQFSKRRLARKGIKGKKVMVVYNGIPPMTKDSIYSQNIREELKLPEGTTLVGTACRLSAQKGLQWFLKAIAVAIKTRPDLRFVIWGDGPQKEYLQELSKELNIERYVIFAGYRPDIPHCLSALDIFVMSSYVEYFSIALLEAMRTGLPIVATNVGGNPEAIEDGVQGILVPYANFEALADGILRLANDKQLRETFAKKAQQRFLDQFTSENMVEKTGSWLMDCVNKHKNK